MTRISIAVVLTVATSLFITSAVAQREGYKHSQAARLTDKSETATSSLINDDIRSKMAQMIKDQQATAKIVAQLMTNFAAIASDQHPKVLEENLTKHGALLEQLEAKVKAREQVMETMHHMMGGSKMSGDDPGAKPAIPL